MKIQELCDPVAAAREMEDLNAQMVDATGEYRALRTPAALKKITDLNVKIQKLLADRGREYGSIYETLDSKVDLEQIEDNSKMTQWVLKTSKSSILFEMRWFGSNHSVGDFYFKDIKGGYKLTGNGDELKIFAACKQILEWAIKEKGTNTISFEADKSAGNGVRDQVYRRLLKRWTPPGFEFSEITDEHSANFFLRKKRA